MLYIGVVLVKLEVGVHILKDRKHNSNKGRLFPFNGEMSAVKAVHSVFKF